jgi:hypothetical protein
MLVSLISKKSQRGRVTMKKNIVTTIATTAAAGALLASATSATAASGEWEFALSPLYLWGLSIDGTSTINGKTAPLDLEFKDDILENMEMVFTFHFEARRDDWTIFAEYNFMDLKPDGEFTQGPISGEVEIDFDATIIELGTGWAFSESESTRWELIGGGRYIDQEIGVDVTIKLPDPIPDQRIKQDGGDDWAHVFAGVRVFHKFTDRWTMSARGDFGFAGADNRATNANLIFDYRFRDWGSAFVGYRYQDYYYDSSSYGYDADQQGPLLGFTFYW